MQGALIIFVFIQLVLGCAMAFGDVAEHKITQLGLMGGLKEIYEKHKDLAKDIYLWGSWVTKIIVVIQTVINTIFTMLIYIIAYFVAEIVIAVLNLIAIVFLLIFKHH